MAIDFILKESPSYMPDKYCRACDSETDFVLEALGTHHIFPCCNTPECREEVKTAVLSSLKVSERIRRKLT